MSLHRILPVLAAIASLSGPGCAADAPVRRWQPVYSAETCAPLEVRIDGKPLAITSISAHLSEHWSVDHYDERLDVAAGGSGLYDFVSAAVTPGGAAAGWGAAQAIPATIAMLPGSLVAVGGSVSLCVATPPGGVVLAYGSRRGQRIEVSGRIDAVIADRSVDTK